MAVNPLDNRVLVGDGVVVNIAPFGDKVMLNEIRSFEPGLGKASAELQRLVNDADKFGVTLKLTARPIGEGGLNQKQLISWYKRYGFRGVNDATHGQHNRNRAPGSLGASSHPSRVFKGMKMAGQTGNKRNKIINLRVVRIIPEENLLLLKGSVPGSKGSYLIIEK